MNETSPHQLTIAIIELVGGAAFERAVREANAFTMGHPSIAVIAIRKQTDLQTDAKTSSDTIPLRRAKALVGCRTTFLALVEDTIQISPEWVEAAQAIIQTDSIAAAWGPIGISADLPARYRALGLLEYGRHQRCQEDNPNAQISIPGACMLYRLDDITGLDCVHTNGIIEHELVEQLLKQDLKIQCDLELGSKYMERDPYGGKLGTRFLHGRLYASTQLKGSGVAQRVIHTAKAFLLAPVFFVRAIRDYKSTGTITGILPEFFWVLLLSSAWAYGEFTGAILGAGDSAAGWT